MASNRLTLFATALMGASLMGAVLISTALLGTACSTTDVTLQEVPETTARASAVSGIAPTDVPVTEAPSTTEPPETTSTLDRVGTTRTGAMRLIDDGFAQLDGQRVGLIVHNTSVVDGVHLIDWFDAAPNVELVAIFGPEHGVGGTADAGERVTDSIDPATGVPIYSLYGETREPTPEMLAGIDVLVFDVQDVGTRFYTYTATMGLAMQAAARHGVKFVVLDRPNPIGGFRVEGPVRTPDQESFVGLYPTPSSHSLTAGELALAVQGRAWLPELESLDLSVIELDGWSPDMMWEDSGLEWLPPSPGLPTVLATTVYPGTVLTEATNLSRGTGTSEPFTTMGGSWVDADVVAAELNRRGLPGVRFEPLSFTPRVIPDVSPNPKHVDELQHGVRVVVLDRRTFEPVRVGYHLIEVFEQHSQSLGLGSIIDRPASFDRLAGDPAIQAKILAGVPADQIWEEAKAGHAQFLTDVEPYRLY